MMKDMENDMNLLEQLEAQSCCAGDFENSWNHCQPEGVEEEGEEGVGNNCVVVVGFDCCSGHFELWVSKKPQERMLKKEFI